MGKKHRGGGGRKRPGPASRWPVALVAVLVLALGAFGLLYSPTAKQGKRHLVPGGERRPTLEPALFTGAVARGYQVAREIPGVLDQLYCYCNCIENFGHLSNLSCFTDRHGAG